MVLPAEAGAGRGTLDASSVFAFNLFLLLAEFPYRPRPMPPEQWQAVVGRRSLTPAEQAAREAHFHLRSVRAVTALPAF